MKIFSGIMLGVLFHLLNGAILVGRNHPELDAVLLRGVAQRAVPVRSDVDDVAGGAALSVSRGRNVIARLVQSGWSRVACCGYLLLVFY